MIEQRLSYWLNFLRRLADFCGDDTDGVNSNNFFFLCEDISLQCEQSVPSKVELCGTGLDLGLL